VLPHRLELGDELHPHLVVLLLPRERQLHARSLGEIDQPHAIADVLELGGAAERELYEGIAVERPVGPDLDVGPLGRKAFGARTDPAAREEMLAALVASAPEQLRQRGRVVGDREIAGFDRHAAGAHRVPNYRSENRVVNRAFGLLPRTGHAWTF